MGWDGDVVTFLRPHSLGLSQDVAATLTWGGVGWDVNVPSDYVPSTLHKMLMLRSHGVGWGGVGWGDANVHPTLHKDCDAASVGWGGMGR